MNFPAQELIEVLKGLPDARTCGTSKYRVALQNMTPIRKMADGPDFPSGFIPQPRILEFVKNDTEDGWDVIL